MNTPVTIPPALRVRRLAFAHSVYPGAAPLAALIGLNFSLARGELLCLAGVNGSGKSTLLCLMAGLYACTDGCLEVFGHDLVRSDEKGRQAASLQSALLLQDPDMQVLGATLEEDMLLGLSPDARKTAFTLARRLGLGELFAAPVHTLSYGQKRKLCLATALLREPALLLLDEPFSGLDYPAVKELRAIFRQCRADGTTLVISTHDIEPVLEFTDKVLLLSPDGESLFGPPEVVLPHAARMGVRPPLVRDFP